MQPALQPLRVLRAGHVAADLAPDRRLRPALLAVSAAHRQEQPAGDVRSVGATPPRHAPPFANAAGTLIDRTRGNLLDGIIQGGVNSPYGDGIYEFKKNSWQPRVGMAYDLSGNGNTVLRSAFGIYYDQPLVGIFEQNSFTMPPIVNNVTFTGATLANPASGQTATTTGVRTIQATGDRFREPAHDAVERRRDAAVRELVDRAKPATSAAAATT